MTIDWLINWVSDWSIEWVTDHLWCYSPLWSRPDEWLIDWLHNWVSDWSIEGVTDHLRCYSPLSNRPTESACFPCMLGYFSVLRHPPNSDMGYRVFNVRIGPFCMWYTHRGPWFIPLHPKASWLLDDRENRDKRTKVKVGGSWVGGDCSTSDHRFFPGLGEGSNLGDEVGCKSMVTALADVRNPQSLPSNSQ